MRASRREFLHGSTSALIAGALAPALARAAQQPQQPPPIPVFTGVRRNVGTFTMRGGTIGYLINTAGVVVVDSQYPAEGAECVKGVQERSKNRGVDWLINTHYHADHTGGNAAFRGVARKVAAHAKTAELLKQPPPGRAATPADMLHPDTTFTDDWRQTIGDETVRAKFYGVAHTGGDAVITFEKAEVAHMGDLMFNRRPPVIDRPSGGSIRNWAVVLEKVTADHGANTTYIFGHAGAGLPVTGPRADVLHFRDYLTALLDHVQREMKAGKAVEEILAFTGTLKGVEDFGPLNKSVLQNAYEELSGGAPGL
jgi:glyoxylase-like metal-dependent hydrolase (beta-lactamase superfamily II)